MIVPLSLGVQVVAAALTIGQLAGVTAPDAPAPKDAAPSTAAHAPAPRAVRATLPPPPRSAVELRPATDAVPATTAAPADLAFWLDVASQALTEAGEAGLSPEDRDAALIIAEHESHNQPRAHNGWDSNAAAGTPSIGLMQVIGPTMAAYCLPGFCEQANPVDSIVAATRYARSRYGSLSGVPGVIGVRSGGYYVGY
ncbi:hypothetical protein GCM10012275_47690 [Longimycelium tulufanense]|uniref:Transglycosylase SLT domain-containing protein n=1 Tax=Longimycelium tulufanense TaxID=907463 RepID=A0A8J3FVU6_9PSEU|nr:transglycosylase SLT domain-containing protein [Longimycelium tulufanense]GGM71680.1 hypothetical protein GCM10012275_47690 [Longimycelium tulufanense]